MIHHSPFSKLLLLLRNVRKGGPVPETKPHAKLAHRIAHEIDLLLARHSPVANATVVTVPRAVCLTAQRHVWRPAQSKPNPPGTGRRSLVALAPARPQKPRLAFSCPEATQAARKGCLPAPRSAPRTHPISGRPLLGSSIRSSDRPSGGNEPTKLGSDRVDRVSMETTTAARRRRRLLLLLVLLALAAHRAAARFVVEKNSLRVTSPAALRGVYECAIGNFGMPQYGGTMHGVVVYPKVDAKACRPFDASGLSFKPKSGGLPVFLLVDRGGTMIRPAIPSPLITFN